MKQVIVEYGQSLLDCVIQYYGKIDALETFCTDNNLAYDALLITGSSLKVRTTEPVPGEDKQIREYFEKRKLMVVSGMPMNGEVLPVPEDYNYLQQEDEYYILLE